jgi:phosphoribosylglycinamide formyltransferase-1
MYGHFVHEAVIKAKEKESGITVHFVDENYDSGQIILQEIVPVFESDNPEILAKRVLEIEHKIYPQAIKKIIGE